MEVTEIIAVDPGITTGIARVFIETGEILQHWSTPYDQTSKLLSDLVRGRKVVCELFILRGHVPKEARKVLYIEGYVVYLCNRYFSDLHMQTPGQRYSFMPLAKYRSRRFNPDISKHAIDAYAHALAFLKAKPTKEEVDAIYSR